VKVAGLFAGIGGIEQGLAVSGHSSELLCEIWEPAKCVLKHRFPESDVHPDVTELRSVPEVDLITAGFPCQDLSQAGRTTGIAGQKSGLVSHVLRLIDTSDAPLVLLENVPFMLQLDRGEAMSYLAREFEERGFRWAYRTINTLSFLPQRRERVFFLASRGELDPWDVLFAGDHCAVEQETELNTHAHGFYWTEGTRGLGWAKNAVPTLKNGSTVGIPSPPAVLLPDGSVIKPDIRDAERLQGFPIDWTKPAEDVGRKSLRWSLVGNAVSVPVAEWIGAQLVTPTRFEKDLDHTMPKNGKWPKAARSDGNKICEVAVSTMVDFRQRPNLQDFLMFDGEPLSERATRGFLKRAEASSLRFQPGFLTRIREHLVLMEQTKVAAE
jgi:DNA (cytosine-5)-methyltransferase 1